MSDERRSQPRHSVAFEVDYAADENFLIAQVTDISSMGMFITAATPVPVGTLLKLRFTPPQPDAPDEPEDPRFASARGPQPDTSPIEIDAEVRWTTDGDHGGNPGMGVQFVNPDARSRSRIQELVRAVAYVA